MKKEKGQYYVGLKCINCGHGQVTSAEVGKVLALAQIKDITCTECEVKGYMRRDI